MHLAPTSPGMLSLRATALLEAISHFRNNPNLSLAIDGRVPSQVGPQGWPTRPSPLLPPNRMRP